VNRDVIAVRVAKDEGPLEGGVGRLRDDRYPVVLQLVMKGLGVVGSQGERYGLVKTQTGSCDEWLNACKSNYTTCPPTEERSWKLQCRPSWSDTADTVGAVRRRRHDAMRSQLTWLHRGWNVCPVTAETNQNSNRNYLLRLAVSLLGLLPPLLHLDQHSAEPVLHMRWPGMISSEGIERGDRVIIANGSQGGGVCPAIQNTLV
jgi:hypothetical protein